MPCSGFLVDYERSLPTCFDNLLLYQAMEFEPSRSVNVAFESPRIDTCSGRSDTPESQSALSCSKELKMPSIQKLEEDLNVCKRAINLDL